MVRTLIAVSLGLAVAGAFGQPAAESVSRVSRGLDFSGLSPHVLAQMPLTDAPRGQAVADHRTESGPLAQRAEIPEVFGISMPIFPDLQEQVVCEGETAFLLADDWRSVSLATQPPE